MRLGLIITVVALFAAAFPAAAAPWALDQPGVLLFVLENARLGVVPARDRSPRARRLERNARRVEDDRDVAVPINLPPGGLSLRDHWQGDEYG